MPLAAGCPDFSKYQQLAAAKLEDVDEEVLLEHLENCEACAQNLGTLAEPDTLVVLIRQAQTRVDRVPEGILSRLVERLSKLRPGEAPVDRAAATVSCRAVETPTKELYDFLAPPQAPEEIGRLGPYRVLAVLGVGGMGVVFRAEDPQLNRLVALKAMLPSMTSAESGRQRFLREARAAAAIKHDHIVAVYQVGEERGVPYLAMEFLEGEPLDNRLAREGKLPVAEVLRFGREIALGLAAAHKQGLIHRDIKPANLWLEAETGRIKVLDFGLARAAKEASPLTQSGAIVGTPEYMAPEQVQGKSLDERCDLFSLGCVLYRMSTGQMPFKGTDMISTLMAVATENPRPPRELEPGLPPALSRLILHLLAKEPVKRPSSALAVAEALQELEQRIKEGGSTAGAKTARARTNWFGRKGPGPLLIGMAGGLVAAVLAGIVVYWPTARGVVKIESDDPSVEIVFDKTGPTVKGAGKEPITLRAGEHGVLIKRGDFEFETDKFVVEKGETVALRIELLPGIMQVMQGSKVLGQKSMPQPPEGTVPTVADPDRRAAEWVLAIDGTIRIILKETDEEREIKVGGELPRGVLELIFVDLNLNKKVTDAGLARFKDCKNLTGLELYSTKVGDSGLAHLKDCKGLTWIQIGGTLVSDMGLVHLKDCKELAHVDLAGTQVGDVGLAYLKDCKKISHLDLGGTQVSDAWLANLKDYTSLARLHLGSTHVSDVGLAHLNDCKGLTHLNLDGTRVTDVGLANIQDCKNLTSLHLWHTQVSDAGLEHIAGFPKLGYVIVKNTKVTEAGVKKLAAALPRCNIEWDGVTEPK
jgi:predicted Ser/Thr protein kinase